MGIKPTDKFPEIPLPSQDTKRPALWTRRKRFCEGSTIDTMVDQVILNDKLVRILGYNFTDMVERTLEKGLPPIFTKEFHPHVFRYVLSLFMDCMNHYSAPPLPSIFRASLETRSGKQVDLDTCLTVHISRDWVYLQYEFSDPKAKPLDSTSKIEEA
eukprot:TRINITY_DN24362_c0_g1_i1.p1 TRINITY_DN24362_c0_g1~~TRINITY_DN24362_c0_g1_i1.p1  ORF type:complete len:157 (+),score=15.47 TRINITY_DN24362_c0_g1_i1:2-472(+)